MSQGVEIYMNGLRIVIDVQADEESMMASPSVRVYPSRKFNIGDYVDVLGDPEPQRNIQRGWESIYIVGMYHDDEDWYYRVNDDAQVWGTETWIPEYRLRTALPF